MATVYLWWYGQQAAPLTYKIINLLSGYRYTGTATECVDQIGCFHQHGRMTGI